MADASGAGLPAGATLGPGCGSCHLCGVIARAACRRQSKHQRANDRWVVAALSSLHVRFPLSHPQHSSGSSQGQCSRSFRLPPDRQKCRVRGCGHAARSSDLRASGLRLAWWVGGWEWISRSVGTEVTNALSGSTCRARLRSIWTLVHRSPAVFGSGLVVGVMTIASKLAIPRPGSRRSRRCTRRAGSQQSRSGRRSCSSSIAQRSGRIRTGPRGVGLGNAVAAAAVDAALVHAPPSSRHGSSAAKARMLPDSSSWPGRKNAGWLGSVPGMRVDVDRGHPDLLRLGPAGRGRSATSVLP